MRRVRIDLLSKQTEAGSACEMQRPAVVGFVSDQGLEQGGLASAVGADDSDAIAGANDDRSVAIEQSAADSLFECIESEQQGGSPERAP